MRDSRIIHLENQGITARVTLQNLLPLNLKPILTTRTSKGKLSPVRILKGINPNLNPKALTPQDLIEDDRELDWQNAGKVLDMDQMTIAYFDPQESIKKPVSDFQFIDVVYDAKGNPIDRRPHLTRKNNINDALPVKLGKRIPLSQALTAFAFRHTYQLVHEDGVTMDFLYRIAEELDTKKVMVLLGAGSKGNQPLVIRDKGSPYRGFLYGKIGEGDDRGKYKLLLLLSAQELKLPEVES